MRYIVNLDRPLELLYESVYKCGALRYRHRARIRPQYAALPSIERLQLTHVSTGE